MLKPRSGRATPRMAETPSGMLNSIGLQGPGGRRVRREGPRLAAPARRPRGGLDRRQQRRGLRPAGDPAADRRRHLRHRGQHLLPQRRGPRPGVRVRPGGCGCRGPRRTSGDAVGRTRPRQAVARRDRHRRRGAVGGRRRRRRALAHQHLAGHGHRPHDDASSARRDHRWALRPGDPPGGRALRVAGARRHARGADPRDGWHPYRAGRPRVRPRRRLGSVGGDRGVPRSVGAGPDLRTSSMWRWPSAGSPGSPTRSGTRTGRRTRHPGTPMCPPRRRGRRPSRPGPKGERRPDRGRARRPRPGRPRWAGRGPPDRRCRR